MPKVCLKEMDQAAMRSFLASLGEPAYRGDQLFRWLHRRAAASWEEMSDLPRALRERLAEVADLGVLPVRERLLDPGDGTLKLALELPEGDVIETVGLRYRHGLTACVSSQAGCRMGCAFCASTVGGLSRNLTAAEMVEQVLAVARSLGERVSRVVVMGMGEPLENYDNLVRFLRLIHEPEGLGIGYRRVTVSTCGLVPAMDRLAAEGLPVTLALSLHAPNDQVRRRLMPVARLHPLAEVLAAARRYAERTGRRVTCEYALVEGVNDLPELARELARVCRGFPVHVNLIPLNPAGRGLTPSPPERVEEFRRILERSGVPVTVRRELGLGIAAACGQLRRRLRGAPSVSDGRGAASRTEEPAAAARTEEPAAEQVGAPAGAPGGDG